MPAVVVRQREELGHHERPHRFSPRLRAGRPAVHVGHGLRPDGQRVARHDGIAGRPRKVVAQPGSAENPAAARPPGHPAGREPPAGPSSPSVTNSGMPPASVPITGTPQAWASRTLSPNGSEAEALTSTSSERSTAGTSSTGPTKRDRSPRRDDASARSCGLVAAVVERGCAHHGEMAPCRRPVQHRHRLHHRPDALLRVDAADDPDDRLVGAAAQPGPPRQRPAGPGGTARCRRPGE